MENASKLKLKFKIKWNSSPTRAEAPPSPAIEPEAISAPLIVNSSSIEESLEEPAAPPKQDENLGEQLRLGESNESPEPVKKVSSKAPTIAELAAMTEPPEGMDKKDWEAKIAIERLVNRYRAKMKERFGQDMIVVTPAERSMFKNFYRYRLDLAVVEDTVSYVIDNWPGVKSRYRLNHQQYPVPRTFADAAFAKQIFIEFHKKTNVTQESPQYVADFEDDGHEQQYNSDF